MKKLAILTLLLTGCTGGERVANAPQPGDTIQLPPVEWVVVDRDRLLAGYRASGKELAQGNQLEGFTGIRPDGTRVIYTLQPRMVDDQVTCTLGHEFMHIALGDYHASK